MLLPKTVFHLKGYTPASKTGNTSAYFLRFDIKTEEIPFWVRIGYGPRLKAKQFQHCVWPVALHGIALPDFYIVCSFFYKKSKQARVPTFGWLLCDDATTAKGPPCDEIYINEGLR